MRTSTSHTPQKAPNAAVAAYSLVEVLGAIAVTAVLLGVITPLYTTLSRLDRRLSGQAAAHIELNRLAAYFRADAHRAVAWQPPPSAEQAESADEAPSADPLAWSFQWADGGSVQYRVLDGSLERTVYATSDADGQKRRVRTGRQELALPAGARPQVRALSVAETTLAQLKVSAPADGSPRRMPHLWVEAELGRLVDSTSESHTSPASTNQTLTPGSDERDPPLEPISFVRFSLIR